jgi:hypothetical protein
MANITGLAVGRLASTWTNAFQASDLTALTNGSTILSSLTAFANDGAGNYDQLCKVSMKVSITTASLLAGACVTIWAAEQLDDLTTFGDGGLTAGTQATYTPPWEPLCVMAAYPRSTAFVYLAKSNLLLPPSTFVLALQNNLGVTINSGTVKILTGDINTNAA